MAVEAVTVPADLAPLVRAGIADCVAHLGAPSASFAVPAWGKWARLVTDTRNAKGWPRVFADGRGLTDALLSIWEGIEPVGMSGGHLRDLYADFLDEAAPLVGDTAAAASAFREAGRRWHDLAEAALPADVPEYQRLRELTADLAAGVAAGDEGAEARATAAGELWTLRADLYEKPPADTDFAALGTCLSTVYEAERDAVDALREVL
ncbi:DUF4872 domain-containing protein [Phytohabitans flavus]|uniref:DUF4872 domain-containing protein n=1 Tax=Phytohabitans flavus TaxID=1076124 RepID=UPI003634219C